MQIGYKRALSAARGRRSNYENQIGHVKVVVQMHKTYLEAQ